MNEPTRASATDLGEAWASIATARSADDTLNAMEAMSKRGKLPGFRKGIKGELCSVAAWGSGLDYELRVRARQEASGTVLDFVPSMLKKTPLIWLLVTIISIWPGLPLTDSLLKTYFSGYDFATWMWYLPLTVLPIPPMFWRMWKKSKAAAHAHAIETAHRIAQEVGGSARPALEQSDGSAAQT